MAIWSTGIAIQATVAILGSTISRTSWKTVAAFAFAGLVLVVASACGDQSSARGNSNPVDFESIVEAGVLATSTALAKQPDPTTPVEETPAETAVPEPKPEPEPVATPAALSEVFHSTRHGYSVSYPQGWKISRLLGSNALVGPLGTTLLVTIDSASGISFEVFAAVVVEELALRLGSQQYGVLSRGSTDSEREVLIEATANLDGLEFFLKFLVIDLGDRYVTAVSMVRQSLKDLH